jgi:hypothetical protein
MRIIMRVNSLSLRAEGVRNVLGNSPAGSLPSKGGRSNPFLLVIVEDGVNF